MPSELVIPHQTDIDSSSSNGGITEWWLAGDIPPANCRAAWQAKNMPNLMASYTNLNNPGVYNLYTNTGTPVWSRDDGWIFNADWCIDCGFAAHVYRVYTYIVGFTNCSGYQRTAMAGGDGNWWVSLTPRGSSTYTARRFYRHGSRTIYGAAPSESGVMAIAGGAGYINGVVEAYPDGTTGPTSTHMCLGNFGPGVGTYAMVGNITAAAVYTVTLSAAQVLAVSNAILAL